MGQFIHKLIPQLVQDTPALHKSDRAAPDCCWLGWDACVTFGPDAED